ncbi:ATP-dependent zinc metalloprotease FtsH [bacterium]|nr:ATP-dependent zinc metalloprotease FtsH [bacterium]
MGENNKKRPGGGFAAWRPSLIWIAVLVGVMLLLQRFGMGASGAVTLSTSEFDEVIALGCVKSVTAREGSVNVTGELAVKEISELPEGLKKQLAEMPQGTKNVSFKTTVTNNPEVEAERIRAMKEKGVDYTLKEAPKWGLVSFILPIVLLFALGYFFFNRLSRNNMGMAQDFGRSRARKSDPGELKITFEDVAGCEEAKEETKELIDYLKDPDKFTRIGARIPRGVILVGPPGTGKTLIAKAIAGEAGVPFFSITGSDFVEMFVGVGAARVRDLFDTGRANAPCIIFIDEIDAVGRHRGSGLGNGNDEREQTLNALLVGMDGFEQNDGVIIIAATNRPDVLDPALLRPGRFDRQVILDIPDLKGREAILKVHAKKVKMASDVDLSSVAKQTPGLSGAELENIVNEAAIWAARQNHEEVTMADFEAARDKVCFGRERKSLALDEKDRKITAVHESGHAIVMALSDKGDPVHKVTIIPRGQALGATFSMPEKDRMHRSKAELEDILVSRYAGRVAEEIVFGDITAGASNDIKRATEIARRMVCEWGMSDKLSPRVYGQREETLFLGREVSRQVDYSDETANLIDSEINAFISRAKSEAKQILSEHREALDKLAEALLKYETLEGSEVKDIIEGRELEREKTDPEPEAKPEPEEPESGGE